MVVRSSILDRVLPTALIPIPVALNQDMKAVVPRDDILPGYIAHLLKSRGPEILRVARKSGGSVASIESSRLFSYRIPVPPMEVQREIVRILDTFSALEAELEAELEARRKQYAHYRKTLFAHADESEQVCLGDIAKIGTGSHDTKDAVVDGEYVFYARGRQPLRLDSFDFDEQAIITAGDGVGVGKVFHFADGKYALHQRAYRIVPNENVDARYIYHHLVADFARYLERTSVHASVTSLRRPMFLRYPVVLPPIELQRRISRILDNFESLTNDLAIGIPAELEARGKQYEHYRDRLLTFEEVQA
jgi:type I restriction enzyme S subunit